MVVGAVVGVGPSGRVGVEEDVAEAGDAVDQPVAGVFEDVVGGGEVEGGVEGDVGVSAAAAGSAGRTAPLLCVLR